jgi:hypothetical protein
VCPRPTLAICSIFSCLGNGDPLAAALVICSALNEGNGVGRAVRVACRLLAADADKGRRSAGALPKGGCMFQAVCGDISAGILKDETRRTVRFQRKLTFSFSFTILNS